MVDLGCQLVEGEAPNWLLHGKDKTSEVFLLKDDLQLPEVDIEHNAAVMLQVERAMLQRLHVSTWTTSIIQYQITVAKTCEVSPDLFKLYLSHLSLFLF